MPAEWEPHAATWLAWPHYQDDWPGRFEPIPWVYAEIIRNLARHERVELIVRNAYAGKKAREILRKADALSTNVHFHYWASDRVWLRDSGCLFLTKSKKDGVGQKDYVGPGLRPGQAERSSAALALKFRFNAWAKYSNWRHDEKIGGLMAKAAHTREIRPLSMGARIVLEGGSIDVNRAGPILSPDECRLRKFRKPIPQWQSPHNKKSFPIYLAPPHPFWLGPGNFANNPTGP